MKILRYSIWFWIHNLIYLEVPFQQVLKITRDLILLIAIIGGFLAIGAILIATKSLPEEHASQLHPLTNISLNSEVKIIQQPTPEDNTFIYAVNDIAQQGIDIAQDDPRVKQIIEDLKSKSATVTIAAVQPTVIANKETGELLHSSAGQVIITANWQIVDGSLYSMAQTFEELADKNVESHQQVWNLIINLDKHQVTEISLRADRVVTETITANLIHTDVNMFVPNLVKVNAGSEVKWTNHSKLPHNVVGVLEQTANTTTNTTSLAADSGVIDPSRSWKYRFDEEGIFSYICTIHSEEGMRGTIIVLPRSDGSY